ncbi:MAG: asparagine synthase (glutamine-hydrolyzing) [Nitrospirae bacterium]|nr:MAG: asparagine synthase (glutamine-hydrolyzing) [Nitrospirota bacterium]
MCGIAGIVQLNRQPLDSGLLESMTRSLAHRGPDGEGYVLLAQEGPGKPIAVTGRLSDSLRSVPREYSVGFGHRRLAILDRSPLGHQPMSCERGDLWLTYNGEIYNYLEIRQTLQQRGWTFRSMSDAEVLLYAYREWGEDCLHRFNGMFAFALWDARAQKLFCARDRWGMKPFYYRVTADRLTFGSEIKALLQESQAAPAANQRLVHAYLLLGLQDHTDGTMFEGVHQLRPGHVLTVERGRLRVRKWWTLDTMSAAEAVDDAAAVRTFQDLFADAVRLHLRSDVPVGSCLSGGLDSSSIVCTMQRRLATKPARTFSACFDEPACDERPYLHAVVAQTGVESLEVFPDGRRLYRDLPLVLWHQEEPFGSTSFLAQWAVMQAAGEQGIKVLLDGQGGDELLCGYPGYWGSYFGDLVRQGALGKAWHELRAYRASQGGPAPTVAANIARALLPSRLVASARSRMKGHGTWVNREFAARYSLATDYEERGGTALANHVGAYLETYSLPALLHHEDRSSMAFSVEARLPFLDVRLADQLLRWPARLKLREGMSKVILRAAMEGVLPESVRLRTDKMGFVTPQDRWLRETWRPDVEALFQSPAFAQRGYWDPVRLRQAYRDYCAGRTELGNSIWRCLCLELWHQRFLS